MKNLNLFSNTFAGLISGLMTVIAGISYATLIFSGNCADYLQLGITGALISAAVIGLFVSLRSSSPVVIAGPDANISAILALIAGSIASDSSSESSLLFSTFFFMLAGCSLLSGIFLFTVGRFRLGRWIRFIPFPVVGGFLAGTGWLLVCGSFKVMSGISLSFSSLSSLCTPENLLHWLPGMVFAMILLLILRRFRHFLIMPAALLLAIIISHIVLFAAGMSAETAMKQGFLLSPFPSDMFIRSFSAFSFSGINLSVFAANAGNLAALMIVAAIVILLNAASVELTTKQDVELDHELSVTGIANIISAPMGSLTGCMALSRTILNFKAGATGRISGIISALFCGIILLFGAKALSLFPRPVLGGLLLYLGLSLLMEWVYDGWVRLSRFDYFLVITIVVIIAMWGFLPGVGIGLIIACMLFAINYSRTGAIRQILTGAGYRSNVERSLKQEEILRHKGDQIYIVKLQGFIFFGTAYPLLIHIKERVLSQDMPQVHFIVLDFRRVTDLDSSSILSFSKIIQFAQSRKVTMLFAGMKEKISHLLEEVDCISRGTAHDQSCSIFPDLDYALGWCEDRIIESEETASLESSRTFADYFSGMFEKQELMNRLMNHLERLEKQSGFVLFERGEPSTSMYFVESGEITAFIELSQEKVRKRLRTMGPGTVIGEMGLYLGTTRSATVVTEKASVLYRLSAESLDAIEKNDLELSSALHRFFVRLLANRLIHANEEIALLVR